MSEIIDRIREWQDKAKRWDELRDSTRETLEWKEKARKYDEIKKLLSDYLH